MVLLSLLKDYLNVRGYVSAGAPMSKPILWLTLGALAVQTTPFCVKGLHSVHFWVLTLFNLVVPVRTAVRDSRGLSVSTW